MKKILATILALILVLSTASIGVFADDTVIGYSSARVDAADLSLVADILDYDAANPAAAYKITQAAGLVKLAEIVNGKDDVAGVTLADVTIYLAGDINMGLVSAYAPIGVDKAAAHFEGTFDGQGHVIDNLKLTSTQQNAGLFGSIQNATIKNLVIGSGCRFVSNYSGEDRFAAIAGQVDGACLIDNCYNMANVVGNKLIGGFAGRVDSNGNEGNVLTIKNSTNAGDISGLRRTGGFVGVGGAIAMDNCRNTGDVYTMDCTDGAGVYNPQHCAGGLVGLLWGQSLTVTNCINNGAIKAAGSAVGGLLGVGAYSVSGGSIASSINYGSITMEFDNLGSYEGPIVGHDATGKISVDSSATDRTGQTDDTLEGDIETITPNFIHTETTDPTGDPNAGPILNPYDDDVTDTVGIVGFSSQRVEKVDLTEIPALSTWTAESEETAYKILTADELQLLADIVNDGNSMEGITIYQGAELDMVNIIGMPPIGWNDDKPFSGTYDGQGYIIDNYQPMVTNDIITVEGSAEYVRYGLFGTLDGATVKNVVLGENCVIANNTRRGHICAGGIAGMVIGTATIDNCYVMAILITGLQHVGGIVGNIAGMNDAAITDRVIIRNCTVTSEIVAEYTVGGMVGTKGAPGSLIVKNCRTTNVVENSLAQDANRTGDKVAAGVVGVISAGIVAITNVTNTAEIRSKTTIAGVFGHAQNTAEVVLKDVTLYGSMTEEDETVVYGQIYATKGVRASVVGEDEVELKFGEEDETLDLEEIVLGGGSSGNEPGGTPDTPDTPGTPDTPDDGTGSTVTDPSTTTTDKPNTTTPATQTPADGGTEAGCASAVGGMLVILLAGGAALTVCKRKQD